MFLRLPEVQEREKCMQQALWDWLQLHYQVTGLEKNMRKLLWWSSSFHACQAVFILNFSLSSISFNWAAQELRTLSDWHGRTGWCAPETMCKHCCCVSRQPKAYVWAQTKHTHSMQHHLDLVSVWFAWESYCFQKWNTNSTLTAKQQPYQHCKTLLLL